MEYANAGDLNKEILRYPGQRIPESGAKFYARQIGSGLRYLHHKGIIHNDLKDRNILLKYNRNGNKTCLLCDFGLSVISSKARPIKVPEVRDDVYRFCRLIMKMMGNESTHETQFIQSIATHPISDPLPRDGPRTVEQVLQLE